MTPEEHDKPVRDLIARCYLSPDLCSSDPKDIEAMLDALVGRPLAEDQIDRMLKKANGDLPVGEREAEEPEWSEDTLSEEESELVALHRNEGGELPPEVEETLRRLREKAKEVEDSDNELET